MSYEPRSQYQIALEDFRKARRQAATSEILRRLRGQPVELLPFETVQEYVTSEDIRDHSLKRIPLNAIVGSVGRYADFTRDFLPRSGALQNRWARVRSKFRNPEDMPPIKVYQVGEVYFVLDGNHRVSIARESRAKEIRAYVTELQTTIQISPETDLDTLILEIEEKEFLKQTKLDKLNPLPDLRITTPGKYRVVIQQIENFQKTINENRPRKITFVQAAKDWYRYIYMPAVQLIQEYNLLRDFPERTETDLYIWISQHQEELYESLGWEIDPENAAADLADQFSLRPQRVIARWTERVLEKIKPPPMDSGPKIGQWRQHQLTIDRHDQLFARILVPLSGEPNNWQAFDQAVHLAKLESASLWGLHVISKENRSKGDLENRIKKRFAAECQKAEIQGELATDEGEITPTIVKRARWSDLVVVHLAHPPFKQEIRNLAPGFHRLVQRCPQPILVVPRATTCLKRILLAFDGSPKSNEALFIAAYMAGKWELPLTVLTIITGDEYPQKVLARARWYLNSHRIVGDVHVRHGETAQVILRTAEEGNFDLTLMGGYSHSPMMEIVLGSTVNKVLQGAKSPLLICR